MINFVKEYGTSFFLMNQNATRPRFELDVPPSSWKRVLLTAIHNTYIGYQKHLLQCFLDGR